MVPAARGSKRACRVSRRLVEVDGWLNDSKRDRITDVVRQHIDVILMVALLNDKGWAGVVAAIPRHARDKLLVFADELETEVIDAISCVQRWFRRCKARAAANAAPPQAESIEKVQAETFYMGEVTAVEAEYECDWSAVAVDSPAQQLEDNVGDDGGDDGFYEGNGNFFLGCESFEAQALGKEELGKGKGKGSGPARLAAALGRGRGSLEDVKVSGFEGGSLEGSFEVVNGGSFENVKGGGSQEGGGSFEVVKGNSFEGGSQEGGGSFEVVNGGSFETVKGGGSQEGGGNFEVVKGGNFEDVKGDSCEGGGSQKGGSFEAGSGGSFENAKVGGSQEGGGLEVNLGGGFEDVKGDSFEGGGSQEGGSHVWRWADEEFETPPRAERCASEWTPAKTKRARKRERRRLQRKLEF